MEVQQWFVESSKLIQMQHKPKFAELEKKIEAVRIRLSKNNTKENQELFIKAKLELEMIWN